MNLNEILTGLPGAELIREGLDDLAAGKVSVPSCLAALAARRLRRAGGLPELPAGFPVEVELHLYRLLRGRGGDAYSRYNALLRELTSFEQALDHRLARRNLRAQPANRGTTDQSVEQLRKNTG